MVEQSNQYEIEYRAGGVIASFVVSASDIGQALAAASVKLAMRYRAEFEITGIRDEIGPIRSHFHSLYTDDVEEILHEIVKWAHSDPMNFQGHESLQEIVFFSGCLSLIDSGYDLPDDFRNSFDRLWHSLLPMNWNIDTFDEQRQPFGLGDAARDIAYAFLGTWGAIDRPLDSDMNVPWDSDAEVDFQDSVEAYLFLIAVRGHAASSSEPDELLLKRYDRVLPRFLAANGLVPPTARHHLSEVGPEQCLKR